MQDLLRVSGGLNLGCDYLPGALDCDPAAGLTSDPGVEADRFLRLLVMPVTPRGK